MIFVSTTSLLNHSNAAETIKKLVDVGIRNIELGADHAQNQDLGLVIKLQKEFGLNYTIHTFFPPFDKKFVLNIGSPNEKVLQESIRIAKQCLDFANKIDAKLYSLHAGYPGNISDDAATLTKETPFQDCLEKTERSLIELSDYAKQYGLRIAVENQSGVEKITDFIRPTKINSLITKNNLKNVGLLIDVGHLNVAATKTGFDKKKEIEQVKDKILELHIHQNDGSYDQHKPLTDFKILECIPLEIIRKSVATIEGNNWKIEDITKSVETLKSFI